MKLLLTELPDTVLGIYGPNKNILGRGQRFLHPEAAKSFMKIDAGDKRLRVSDMFRTAESSLLARSQKTGVQPVSFSAHGYGFSIDIDVTDCLQRLKMTKKQLDEWLESDGWYCHRIDHKIKSETWHFNYLGPEPEKYLKFQTSNRAACVEAKIKEFYGHQMSLTNIDIQQALHKLGMYNGEIDGAIGPRSKEGIKAFQRAWKLPNADGIPDARFQRTLAFVVAEKIIV